MSVQSRSIATFLQIDNIIITDNGTYIVVHTDINILCVCVCVCLSVISVFIHLYIYYSLKISQ